MRLSRTSLAVGCALLTHVTVAVAGCGGDAAGKSRDAGESGAGGAGSGGQGGEGGSGGSSGGGDAALDGGLPGDAARPEDAAAPLPAPGGFTISSGGGSSTLFNIQVGIGTPIAVTQGAGQSHRLALGSPVLVQGSQRR